MTIAFADENQVLLMKHAESGGEVDVSRAWLPFEMEAFKIDRLRDLDNAIARILSTHDKG